MDNKEEVPQSPATPDTPLGCEHYRRKCLLVSPCCGKIFTCRFCHDEKEDHSLTRHDLTEVVCAVCKTQQPIQQNCSVCHVTFGKYFCESCKLFDDEDKEQFHCSGCGICRVGGRSKYYHCDVCDMCLPNKMKGNHRCVEKVSRANCPVCMEDIHTSRMASHIPPCCHFIHRSCYINLLHTGYYACPICQTSMLDMTKIWKHFDDEIAATPMTEEYCNYYVPILCKDCHKESLVLFHVLGLKCMKCGSYNTCRTKGSAVRCPPREAASFSDDTVSSDSGPSSMESIGDEATEGAHFVEPAAHPVMEISQEAN